MMRNALVMFFIPLLALLLLAACGSMPQDGASTSDDAGTEEFVEPKLPILLAERYPTWLAADRYAPGDVVTCDGKYYRAAEPSQGKDPTAEDGTAWTYLGDIPADLGKYYSDVKDGTWYAEAVNALAEAGILTDSNNHNYFPSRPLTRAQAAALLCRALDIQPVMSGDNFDDAGNDWYTPYLAALKQRNLAIDEDSNDFHPEYQITRQELCKLIYDACDGFSEDPVTVFAPYADSDEVAAGTIRPVSWCVERGILKGYGGRLQPEKVVSRAEAAQIFYNLLYPNADS